MKCLFKIAVLFALAQPAMSVDTDPMARLDTNQNRLLEESEAQAAGRQLFGSINEENRDGSLQPEEIKDKTGGPVQKAADTDADGALNSQEYAAILTARYKSANGNGDGLVDPSELSSLTGQLLLVMIVAVARQFRGLRRAKSVRALRAWRWWWRPRHRVGSSAWFDKCPCSGPRRASTFECCTISVTEMRKPSSTATGIGMPMTHQRRAADDHVDDLVQLIAQWYRRGIFCNAGAGARARQPLLRPHLPGVTAPLRSRMERRRFITVTEIEDVVLRPRAACSVSFGGISHRTSSLDP